MKKMDQEQFANFLIETARENVKRYFFDVFHDIYFIMEEYRTNADSTFYWAYRESGTCIGSDYNKFLEHCKILGADAQYQIKKIFDGGDRYFEVTKL